MTRWPRWERKQKEREKIVKKSSGRLNRKSVVWLKSDCVPTGCWHLTRSDVHCRLDGKWWFDGRQNSRYHRVSTVRRILSWRSRRRHSLVTRKCRRLHAVRRIQNESDKVLLFDHLTSTNPLRRKFDFLDPCNGVNVTCGNFFLFLKRRVTTTSRSVALVSCVTFFFNGQSRKPLVTTDIV